MNMSVTVVLFVLMTLYPRLPVMFASQSGAVGDPRSCLDQNKELKQFDILPGTGWDNLRNEDGVSVFEFSFSTCKTTRDGRFLIPDDVEVLPQRYSRVNTFSEMFSHFSEYTSINSHSINLNGKGTRGNNSISGTFSFGYERAKSRQIRDRSVTTRVQLRYLRYTARVKPTAKLNPDFKAQLIDIANNLGQNGSDVATFKSQLLVRDYGTHVIRNVDAGAILAQEDQVSSDFVKHTSDTKVTFGASLSFFYKFNFGLGYTGSIENSQATEYENERKSSVVTTYGGKQFKAFNFTANEWAEAIDDNMVAVDREGVPIYYLITSTNIPELHPDKVRRLYHSVKMAVEVYFKYNTYRGCMNLDSPNFSPIANIDDGNCAATNYSLMFGGTYQTCDLRIFSTNGDICTAYKMNQRNPKTGDYSCPDGYQSVKINTDVLYTPKPNARCTLCFADNGFGINWCCHDQQYYKYRLSTAEYSLYWCAATSKAKEKSGYLFGGLFTSDIVNPLTQGLNCPLYFQEHQLGTDLHICTSSDYNLGSKYAVPFGGFFSCQTLNPLAENTQGCPLGFSQHLAYVDQGCDINYCVKTGALSGLGLPRIRRPPFMDPPDVDSAVKYMIMDPKTQKWQKVEDDEMLFESPSEDKNTGLTTAAIVAICLSVCVFGCTVTSVGTCYFCNKKVTRMRKQFKRVQSCREAAV